MVLIFTSPDDGYEHLILENKIEVILGNGHTRACGDAGRKRNNNTVWIDRDMILDPNVTSPEKARMVFDEIVNAAFEGNHACDLRPGKISGSETVGREKEKRR